MKRLMFSWAVTALLAAAVPAFAGSDRLIGIGELPAVSRQFIETHFSGAEVSYAKVDEEWMEKDYKVVCADGTTVEFAKDGAWKEVDCKTRAVPAGIVPPQIREYVAKNFPGRHVTAIEQGRRNYEVELDNGIDLKFDLKFRLTDIDD